MYRQITIFSVLMAVGISLSGCSSSGKSHIQGVNPSKISGHKELMISEPNPAAVYCHALGYEYKIVINDNGNQSGIC